MLTPRSGGGPAKYALNAAVLSAFAIAAGSAIADDHRGISQSGEQKNMRRVGHVDLRGRPSYQPNVIVYPDGRTIAFAGTHGGSKPNPLKGGAVEPNDDHRRHPSGSAGREIPYSGPGRRRPGANGAHVFGFRPAGRRPKRGL